MKTINFKIFASIITILLVISSSIALQASEQREPITCYISPIGQLPCSIPVLCGTVGPMVCTATYQGMVYQGYAKQNPSDTFCPVTCYRFPQ